MLKTAQEMLEMGFKFSPLTLGPRHDLPISHQALKKFLLHEHAWPSWKLAEVGRRGGGVGWGCQSLSSGQGGESMGTRSRSGEKGRGVASLLVSRCF